MFQFEVTGERQLREVTRALRGADKELRKQLRKRLAMAVKPLGAKAKAGIPAYLPSGYAPILRKAFRVRSQIKLTGHPNVTITAKAQGKRKARDVRAMNQGTLRHPVFANRAVWVAQKIRSGFWSDPMRAGAPAVRAEALEAIADTNKKIIREVS